MNKTIALVAALTIVGISIESCNRKRSSGSPSDGQERTSRRERDPAIEESRKVLDSHGLATGSWSAIGTGEWGANSRYVKFPKSRSPNVPLPNNLSFYTTGSRDELTKYELALKINDHENAARDIKKLKLTARDLAESLEIATNVAQLIPAYRDDTRAESYADYKISSSRDDWPSGRHSATQTQTAPLTLQASTVQLLARTTRDAPPNKRRR